MMWLKAIMHFINKLIFIKKKRILTGIPIAKFGLPVSKSWLRLRIYKFFDLNRPLYGFVYFASRSDVYRNTSQKDEF